MTRALATVAFTLGAALGPAEALAQAERDPLPLMREVVRSVHLGIVAQRGAPWRPDAPRLLIDPTAPPVRGGRWGSEEELVPPGLSNRVPVRVCGDACEPDRPGQVRLSFGAPTFKGDRHASLEVEARGLHPKDGGLPAHAWRTLTRYLLERHGGEWITVGTEPTRGS